MRTRARTRSRDAGDDVFARDDTMRETTAPARQVAVFCCRNPTPPTLEALHSFLKASERPVACSHISRGGRGFVGMSLVTTFPDSSRVAADRASTLPLRPAALSSRFVCFVLLGEGHVRSLPVHDRVQRHRAHPADPIPLVPGGRWRRREAGGGGGSRGGGTTHGASLSLSCRS